MRNRYCKLAVLALLALSAVGCPKKGDSKAKDPVRHYQVGVEFLRQGRPDRAEVELRTAAALDPANPVISYALGLSYLGMRDFKRAESTFRQVLVLDPTMTSARNNLGIVYAELKQWDRAVEFFREVLTDQRYPTPEVARFNLGRALLSSGDPTAAMPHLKAAHEASPDTVEWQLQYAVALESAERFKEAKEQLDLVVAAEENNADGWYHLGFVSYRLGDLARARTCFRRFLELGSNSVLAERAQQFLRELGE